MKLRHHKHARDHSHAREIRRYKSLLKQGYTPVGPVKLGRIWYPNRSVVFTIPQEDEA